MLILFKPKSAGAKKSPLDSSSGEGASGDAVVGATGVVSRGEVGAGAGSDADVVVTEDVNGLEDYEGASIDMDGAFSDTAHGSGPSDRTATT